MHLKSNRNESFYKEHAMPCRISPFERRVTFRAFFNVIKIVPCNQSVYKYSYTQCNLQTHILNTERLTRLLPLMCALTQPTESVHAGAQTNWPNVSGNVD
jgi:hypothetical protein